MSFACIFRCWDFGHDASCHGCDSRKVQLFPFVLTEICSGMLSSRGSKEGIRVSDDFTFMISCDATANDLLLPSQLSTQPMSIFSISVLVFVSVCFS